MKLENLRGITDLQFRKFIPGEKLGKTGVRVVSSPSVIRELRAALAEGLEDIGPAPDDPRAPKFVLEIHLAGRQDVVLVVDQGVVSTHETSYLLKSNRLWLLLEELARGARVTTESSGTPCLEPLDTH